MSTRLERLPTRIGGVPLTLSAWLRFDLIARAIRETTPASIIEFGTGGGAMATRLSGGDRYIGIEMDDASRLLASERLATVGRDPVLADIDESGADIQPVDLVCAFEVLEHIEDDAAALARWVELLADDGHVLISVPSDPDSFNAIDAHVGHLRRYSSEDISRLCEAAGLDLLWCRNAAGGIGPVLHRIQAAMVSRKPGDEPPSTRERTSASGRFMQPSGQLVGVGLWAASLPFRLFQRLVPGAKGSSFVVLARKVAQVG